MAFLGNMVDGFIRYLNMDAKVIEDRVEIDGSWMAERILTNLPIQLTEGQSATDPESGLRHSPRTAFDQV